MPRKRPAVVDIDGLLALGVIDDTCANELRLVKSAEQAVARDDDWQAEGGTANAWLVDQLKTTTQEMVRIPADECYPCRCPEGKTGKTVHYGWRRRDVVKVKQMRLSASGQ